MEEDPQVIDVVPTELATITTGLTSISTIGNLPVYKINQMRGQGWFALLYGATSSGKTHTAATALDSTYGRPGILFDIDRSSKVVSYRDDLDVVYVHRWEDIAALIKLFDAPHQYKTIILDNMSELGDMCLKYWERSINSKEPRQHYNAMTSSMLNLVRTCRDYVQRSGNIIIMTAWEGTFADDVDGKIRIAYEFNPALQRRIGGLLTNVGYLRITESGRTLHFETHPRLVTKFEHIQGEDIELTMSNPNLSSILNARFQAKIKGV